MMTLLEKTYSGIIQLDQLSLRWIAVRRSPSVNRWMQRLTRSADWDSWALMFLIAVGVGGFYQELAFLIAPKLLATWTLCFIIKRLSKRPRPNERLRHFRALLPNPDPYSFPSSHTACTWVVVASLGIQFELAWPLGIAWAVGVSYSRIHIGAHYPLDVLIGGLIGIGMAFL